MASALDIVDEAIADLQARLNLNPTATKGGNKQQKAGNKKEKKQNNNAKVGNNNKNQANVNSDQPDICKLEFKVGVITKVWTHETADKLYCEEIDVGEEEGPRQIASGLRPHFTLEQMQGQRLLVVANLKAKKLVGFKSHGMVLCAAQPKDDGEGELVEFVEPPADAKIGEVVYFEGLPKPEPVSATQVDKKKIFQTCAEGMKTDGDCVATWNGAKFMTSAGPCKAKTVAGGQCR